MKLIVGLGNPGEKYTNTRHNAGFMFLDTLAQNFKLEKKFEAEIAETVIGEKKVLLAKPGTFMNNSGRAVQSILHFYKVANDNLLLIHDEVDLPLAEVRFAKSSSSAGHNGVQNIIDSLGTNEFSRIRIGVDTRSSRDEITTESFVLQDFAPAELKILRENSFTKAKKLLLEEYLEN